MITALNSQPYWAVIKKTELGRKHASLPVFKDERAIALMTGQEMKLMDVTNGARFQHVLKEERGRDIHIG